ncbi:hypothetical protein [Radiobacillus deserti]|uniref:Uncharacterized protein n=1 Tax=Radiobacillus deserti TaxID=2594883 RepID=A0A516KIK7_9BACI|nr:hypothetical protein [Radiobacillus deserti]QDP41224.1 hypothetical protein FN924_14150 [Radiobacillus deserti]
MREPHVQAALKKFEKLLRQYPDHQGYYNVFRTFLKGFMRVQNRSGNLPTTELFTILKHEKPNIYYALKHNLKDDPILGFVSQIDMDYEQAKRGISDIIN